MKWYKLFADPQEAEAKVPPGGTLRVRAGAQIVCIARSQSGWYAIQDTCPHMDISLAKGRVTPFDEITCPWHAYQFDLRTGRECKSRTTPAKTFPIEFREEGIFLGIAEEA